MSTSSGAWLPGAMEGRRFEGTDSRHLSISRSRSRMVLSRSALDCRRAFGEYNP